MKKKYLIQLAILFCVLCAIILFSCKRHSEVWEKMDLAESLMNSQPDSSLLILNKLNGKVLHGKEAARFALLKSMALDKNYIDTTTFDVLQPAIDYYLKKGSPNEKLKTYYYQGRIFQNKGDRDNALNSFVKGIDIATQCTDSLSIIRSLVAQAYLYYEFYDFDSYTDNHIRAANISKKINHKDYEFSCILNALNGSIILENKNIADSLINICNRFESLNKAQNQSLLEYKLAYVLKFGSKQEIKDLINHQERNLNFGTNWKLNLALAYNKLGNNKKAKQLLDDVNNCGFGYDTLKYQSISISILKDMKNYKEALATYLKFSRRVDSINYSKFEQKAKTIEEKHKIELQAQNDAKKKSRIIWGCLCGIALLVMAHLQISVSKEIK